MVQWLKCRPILPAILNSARNAEKYKKVMTWLTSVIRGHKIIMKLGSEGGR